MHSVKMRNTVYLLGVLIVEELDKSTKFQIYSIFTISKDEQGEKITTVSPDIMKQINQALHIELNLE
jgi:mRNA-degrading endonuclease toxin of MazEF toxin-antitoxin module